MSSETLWPVLRLCERVCFIRCLAERIALAWLAWRTVRQLMGYSFCGVVHTALWNTSPCTVCIVSLTVFGCFPLFLLSYGYTVCIVSLIVCMCQVAAQSQQSWYRSDGFRVRTRTGVRTRWYRSAGRQNQHPCSSRYPRERGLSLLHTATLSTPICHHESSV